METGSLVNLVYSGHQNVLPEVGQGATILGWTDRYPATVVNVTRDKDGVIKSFVVQEDFAYRTDKNGMSECQEYEYLPNPQGQLMVFKRVSRGKAKGLWRSNGLKDGKGVLIGHREKYYDFSF